MFAVVLDTCVLWPSLQRDFLLSLAVEGLYRPVWSSAILAELEEHEARKLVRRGSGQSDAAVAAGHLVSQMTSAFDDACVQGWEPLEGTYGLPDPDDEHVVAAAVVGGAGAIITVNLKDLPADRMPREHPGQDTRRVRARDGRDRPGPCPPRGREDRQPSPPPAARHRRRLDVDPDRTLCDAGGGRPHAERGFVSR